MLYLRPFKGLAVQPETISARTNFARKLQKNTTEIKDAPLVEYQTTAQATEAAITNALLAAETTTGANALRIYALPVDRMLEVMKKYGRLP